MYTIRTLNNISPLGLANLPEKNFTINDTAENRSEEHTSELQSH